MSISDAFEISPQLDLAVRKRCGLSVAGLLERIRQIDDEMMAQEVDPGSRHARTGLPLSKEFGIKIHWDDSDPISVVINSYYRTIYGSHLAIGPFHVGAVMLRDIYYEVHVPIIFGKMRINPWDHVVGDRAQMNILGSICADDVAISSDQLFDIFDFAYGLHESSLSNAPAKRFLSLSKEQIEGACRTLLGSFSKRVAVQGTGYAVEMAGKALLADSGIAERDLKLTFGHNLPKIFHELRSLNSSMDHDRIAVSIGEIPNVIGERYNFDRHGRQRIGNIIRHGQYVLGEIGRAVSTRDFRSSVTPPPERVFPSM